MEIVREIVLADQNQAAEAMKLPFERPKPCSKTARCSCGLLETCLSVAPSQTLLVLYSAVLASGAVTSVSFKETTRTQMAEFCAPLIPPFLHAARENRISIRLAVLRFLTQYLRMGRTSQKVELGLVSWAGAKLSQSRSHWRRRQMARPKISLHHQPSTVSGNKDPYPA